MTTPWIGAFGVLCVFVALLGLLVLGLLRQAVPLLEETQTALNAVKNRLVNTGLPNGMSVPTFRAETVSGEIFSNRDLQGERHVLLFLEPGCKGCESLVDDLSSDRVPKIGAQLVVVGDESAMDRLAVAEASGVTVVRLRHRLLAEIFESDRTPHAFVIDESAIVRASGTPNDWEAIDSLVESATKGGDALDDKTAAVSIAH